MNDDELKLHLDKVQSHGACLPTSLKNDLLTRYNDKVVSSNDYVLLFDVICF